jgi:hypothetical protein
LNLDIFNITSLNKAHKEINKHKNTGMLFLAKIIVSFLTSTFQHQKGSKNQFLNKHLNYPRAYIYNLYQFAGIIQLIQNVTDFFMIGDKKAS